MKSKLFIFSLFVTVAVTVFGDVANTVHNLSTSGPGVVKSSTETEICIFCHTPHSAEPVEPLWNHDVSAVADYIAYWTPTLDAYPSEAAAPEPNGYSKLCLSCHDGTIALGAVRSRSADISVSGTVANPRGNDLSGEHPMSFVVTDALIATNNAKDSPLNPLTAMQTDPDVHLDSLDRVQCTVCHDPHDNSNDATSGYPFWPKATFSEVCQVCHQ